MNLHELLKARLSFTSRYLNQVLNKLTDADLMWVPRDGMKSISELLLEVANNERDCITWLHEDKWPDESQDTFDPERANLEEIKAVIESLKANTLTYIDSLNDAELESPIRPPKQWQEALELERWEVLELEQCPRSEVLRNISAHEWYHTGQLITYLWLRGSDPFPDL